MNWLLLALVWLAASIALTLGWAAAMAGGRRYCANCYHPGGSHHYATHEHAHPWNAARRAVR
ncbi:MAG: hypothetical protein M3133_05195 [Actinomycetota bacterium]|nr:hypothetical protein [Actinomycetota bacterium]